MDHDFRRSHGQDQATTQLGVSHRAQSLQKGRKGYSEAVFHQNTEAFLGALENSFRYFGGTPKTLVIDNLKVAVKQADWYDPEIHPKLQSFA